MKTKDRILLKSIELFNWYGVDSVPLHRIAAELKMSPGNLTYHFKNKNDILKAIYPSMAARLEEALQLPGSNERRPLSVSYVANFQIEIARSLWQYRFFFVALKSVLARDAELERQYWELHNWAIDRLRILLDAEIEHKGMRPVTPPNSTTVIATNQWYLWVSFLFFEGHESKMQNFDENEVIFNAVLRNFSLLLPFSGGHFAEDFVAECRRQLQFDDTVEWSGGPISAALF